MEMNETPSYLLKSVRITDPTSKWDNQVVDVCIRNGFIEEIGERITKIPEACRVLDQLSCVSPGWVDPWNHGAKPGEEHHQSLLEWSQQLAQSGITTVALSPTKGQTLEQVGGVEFRPYSTEIRGVEVHSFAPQSQDMDGLDMVNYQLLAQAGAVGFSDGFPNMVSKALMLESAKYTSKLNEVQIWVVLPDPGLGRTFKVWEGDVALQMGLEGMPIFVENAYLQQLSTWIEYTGKSMVYPLLSGASAVINKGLNSGLTLGTAAHYLWWSDLAFSDFNEGFKFWPPLSPLPNQEAMIQGLKQGLISFVCSDHRPYHSDARETAFADAPFGQSTLSSFSLASWTRLQTCMSPSDFIHVISHNSRALLGLPALSLGEGARAELTLWDPGGKSIGDTGSPWAGCSLEGKIQGRLVQGVLDLAK